jgi:hypothetical protein
MTVALTRRERRLYGTISAVTAAIWIGGLVGYFILSDRAHHATLMEICFFAVNTVIMFGFGYALRNNLRVVRGIPWLQEEVEVREHQ